jgi:hypothetical protein
MANDGDYPLLVHVWNRFENTSDIKLAVTFNHWPNGQHPTDTTPDIEINTNTYQVKPGDYLGFPLYWSDESLTVEINDNDLSKIDEDYYILMGPKAKCTSAELNTSDSMLFIPSGTAIYIDEESKNGVWKISDASLNSNWKITIEKWLFDPETTNVSVGPDLP